jgi:hypothetical protein
VALHADVGLIPAIPLIVIRPFLPESPAWREKKRAGTLKRPSFGELFQPSSPHDDRHDDHDGVRVRAAFGAIQQMPRIVPGLAEVRALPRAGDRADRQRRAVVPGVRRPRGRVALAFLAVRIVSRRSCCTSSRSRLILLPIVFLSPRRAASTCEVGHRRRRLPDDRAVQFLGNYLPRVYPTYLRGTGESFAANVGGRMIGTSAALVTTSLVASMPGPTPIARLAYAGALVGTTVYVIGFIASFWLPEPKQEDLPE